MTVDDEALQSRYARELFSELRQLHVLAGEPSSRAVAEGVGGMSHTTVNQVLRGRRVPSWPVLSKIVKELKGDEASFRVLWNSVREGRGSIEDLPSPGTTRHEVSVFASYAHVDDKATYRRVRTFIQDVGNVYSSMTGRDVGIFLDQASIAPGENWKDRIQLGLSASSIFLAFISPAYLRSVNCSQEFWEFVHFLSANSTTRLMIPLVFADASRLDRQFHDDKMWVAASNLQQIDVSRLRFEPPGSSEWLERVHEVAERIEDVLNDVASRPTEADRYPNQNKNASHGESLDILGRIAVVEKSAPVTLEQMERLTKAIGQFGVQMSTAGPLMSRASTIKKKVSITRQLAKQLDPIADEMVTSTNSIRDGMNDWDATVQATLSFIRQYPNWLQENPEAIQGIEAIQEMAIAGIESFADLDSVHDIFGQGRGLSAALDGPLRKAQDALMAMTDIRGLLVGWREGVDSLELE